MASMHFGREGLGARRVYMQYMSIQPLCPSMYISIYIDTYIYTHICTHACAYVMHTCTYVGVYIYRYLIKRKNEYIPTDIYISLYICT